MKLLSIDIETTGLDYKTCSILEFGAVVFSIDVPIAKDGVVNAEERRWQTFETLIKHSRIQGEPYAIQMNNEIIQELAGVKETHIQIRSVHDFIIDFRGWLWDNGVTKDEPVTVTGKNYDRFDRQFLLRVPGWSTLIEPLLTRRCLDVGSLCFTPEFGKVPNLPQCLDMMGVSNTVTHRAVDDALQVATVVSRFFPE